MRVSRALFRLAGHSGAGRFNWCKIRNEFFIGIFRVTLTVSPGPTVVSRGPS